MAQDLIPGGIVPILYSFFDANGELDRNAWRKQVETVLAAGAPAIAILGLITEVSALSPKERRTLVEWAAEDIGGRVPLMATIAGRDEAEVKALARDAASAGATALILQPPLGQKPNEADLAAFFSSIMASVTIPVGIQNAPEYLGVGLSAPSVITLADRHENFRLMKGEGPVSIVKPYIDALSPRMAIFNGRGGLELPDNLRAGCKGLVPAPDCADIQIAIYNAHQRRDDEEADRLYRDILPYLVFAMQSLDIAIAYGKRIFAKRAGIENSCACRVTVTASDPFLLAAAARWSAPFGSYQKRN